MLFDRPLFAIEIGPYGLEGLPLASQFQNLTLHGTEPASAAPPNSAPAGPAPTPSAATNALGDYTYAIPDGWSTTTYPDGLVHAFTAKNGERCQITVLQMGASSGDVARDAIDAFIRTFKIDPRQNAEYPFPSPTFTRGISGDGWEYFMVQKALTGRVGDVGMPFGRVFAAKKVIPLRFRSHSCRLNRASGR